MKTERDILRKRITDRFIKAFATYHLIEDHDHILVGLSGGKDSLLLLELLAVRARIQHPRFQVEALHVRMENISYETSADYLERFCQQLGVTLHTVTTRFEEIATGTPAQGEHHITDQTEGTSPGKKPPCFLCSWYRRKQLFNVAQQLGCNKIALGHHQDDILHTALMNLTFQGRFGSMPAKLKLRKMPLTIIRPLCMVCEKDIQRYAELAGYEQQKKHCPYEKDTHRTSAALLFSEMEKMNAEARYSIWRALDTAGKLVETD